VQVSIAICIRDPADTLRHAPLAELMQCLIRAAPLPKAVRAIVEVVRVDRFQQHRHRSLDYLVLERRLTDRALAPLVLLDPDALHRRCLIASTAETLMQVAQVLVEVCGISLCRHPIDSWGTCLAPVAIRLPQKVLVDEMGQGRKDLLGIAGGLRRNPLEFGCDAW